MYSIRLGVNVDSVSVTDDVHFFVIWAYCLEQLTYLRNPVLFKDILNITSCAV